MGKLNWTYTFQYICIQSEKVHVSEHSLNMYTRYIKLLTEGHGTSKLFKSRYIHYFWKTKHSKLVELKQKVHGTGCLIDDNSKSILWNFAQMVSDTKCDIGTLNDPQILLKVTGIVVLL